MFNAIEQHPLIKSYLSSAVAWEEQTHEQWRLAAEEFKALRRRQGDSRELSAVELFCDGQASRKIEFYDQAAKSFTKASELLPHWPLPLEGLAATYRRLGRRSEAEEILNRALKIDITLIQSRLLFADLLCERNNYRAAEDTLRLGIKSVV